MQTPAEPTVRRSHTEAGARDAVMGVGFPRREDLVLLRGQAHFVDDLPVEGVLSAHFVRATTAHAEITRIDADEARQAEGVVGVWTAADLQLPGLAEIPLAPHKPRAQLSRPCLATGRVRFVGEAVAVVVAESPAVATDAAELVAVELKTLPALTDPMAAFDGAPLLFPEHGSNVVIDVPGEDPDALDGSEVVVEGSFINQRIAPVPLEPGGILVEPDANGLTVWVSTQTPFGVRTVLCEMLDLSPEAVRVVAPAVGGGFGAKGGVYPEHVVIAAVAGRLGRPVRWVEGRMENLMAMTHGRGQVQQFQLGARADGTLVGLRVRTVNDVGAYPWRASIPTITSRLMSSGVYRIPRVDAHTQAVVTNTTPVGPYRGAGRPEAAALLERSMDLLAARLGLDPAEIRRKNLLRPDEFPYQTPTGASYDSGDYATALDKALEIVGYDKLRAEQQRRRERGDPIALGVGLSCFCEVSGTGPEYGSVRVEPDATVTVISGSSPHGQGHETTLAQVAAETLGVPMGAVRVVHSDTAVVAHGVGTFGSRSGQLAGSAVQRSAAAVAERLTNLAAELMEADPADIVRADGRFTIAGTPARGVTWQETVTAAFEREVALTAEDDFVQPDGTYPFGAHIAVVEVDTGTGGVRLSRLVAVEDCGRIINPLVVAGQVHGGLAQGVAQALFESVSYDHDGNPLTVTLADYLVPSAADLPSWELSEMETPSPHNPLGAKGIGESGTVGSTPAVQNAVVDALAAFGVSHIDLPLSPQRVWEAVQGARADRSLGDRTAGALGT